MAIIIAITIKISTIVVTNLKIVIAITIIATFA